MIVRQQHYLNDRIETPWVAPPYGQQIGAWTEKAVSEYQKGRVTAALLLVRPAIGSAWYQALTKTFPRCEPDKRIRFMDAHGVQQTSPVHGNVFFYLGKDVERFWRMLSGIGILSVPINCSKARGQDFYPAPLRFSPYGSTLTIRTKG